MTRHGKNCTAGAVYTYHEKKKDTAASGYGTQSIRLGKDAIKDYDCCCLSLQPCQDPAYEKQKQTQKSNSQLESKSEERECVERFKTRENSIVSKPINPFMSGQNKESEKGRTNNSSAESSSVSADPSTQSLPSFWIPSLTPEAKPTLLKKPSKVVSCPMSGRPIKMNELITVCFTPLDPGLDRVALLTRQDRYVCAVTRDVLGNSVPCAVLRTSGNVVTQECVEKLIKKDMIDPVTGDKLSEKDIIPLQRGGTGYAASGVDLHAKEARPVMQV
ncbi:Nitric oxide synthase-interacting protein E3 ubiquitin-protein ligase NOSIP [Collichthys lucidus]|uniref:Nitric oxide synthase-interacting protein n=1 Tax=Collichthys lucidus TaxID=240159 RepID=A0A4U5VIJ1_COLLU|nr:Nitric oxide synthase-interacting protein E3 ubiquitin-protein ligase NOSIP [Collichthys lucidus]